MHSTHTPVMVKSPLCTADFSLLSSARFSLAARQVLCYPSTFCTVPTPSLSPVTVITQLSPQQPSHLGASGILVSGLDNGYFEH